MATSSLTQRQVEEKLLDASPFSASNTTDITTTSVVEIKAAVTGKRHWIKTITVTNKTETEFTQVIIQDDATSPEVLATLNVVGDTGTPGYSMVGGSAQYTFDPPIEVAAGQAIDGKTADATTGDILVTINGWVEA